MSILEIILYSLFMGVLALVCGYLSIIIPYKKDKTIPKTYQFSNPIDYDLKSSVDESYLFSEQKSGVDGNNAATQFKSR